MYNFIKKLRAICICFLEYNELIPKLTNQPSFDGPRIYLERTPSKTRHEVPENYRRAVGRDKETPAQARTDRKAEGRRQEKNA